MQSDEFQANNYTWQKQCQCEITMAGLAINLLLTYNEQV